MRQWIAPARGGALVLALGLILIGCAGSDSPTESAEATETAAPASDGASASEAGSDAPSEGVVDHEGKAYVVGALAQMTGDAAWFGELVQNGTTLALEDIEEDGSLAGASFDVKFRDLQGDAQTAVSEFRKFVDVDNVPVVLMGTSYAVLPICPIAEELDVIILNDGASSPLIPDACGQNLISNIPTSVGEMQELASYLYNEKGFRTASIFYTNVDVNVGQKDAFANAWEALGGELLAEESAERETPNYRAQATRLREAGADVALVATEAQDTGRFLRQAADIGYSAQFVAQSNAVGQQVLDQAGDAAEGMIFAQVLFDPSLNPELAEFEQRYADRFGENPALLYSALAYDGTMMVAEAISAVGDDPQAIGDYLRGLTSWSGVSGDVRYEEPGVAMRDVSFTTVQDGEFVPLD